MEITKELKEKLLNANSEEEVKALLGEGAAEEETARIWHEIRKNRNPSDLESVDDDELEAVSGAGWCAFLGEYEQAVDGRDIGCVFVDYADWAEANSKICPKGNATDGWYHKWEIGRVFRSKQGVRMGQFVCTKCGKQGEKSHLAYSDPMFGQ